MSHIWLLVFDRQISWKLLLQFLNHPEWIGNQMLSLALKVQAKVFCQKSEIYKNIAKRPNSFKGLLLLWTGSMKTSCYKADISSSASQIMSSRCQRDKNMYWWRLNDFSKWCWRENFFFRWSKCSRRKISRAGSVSVTRPNPLIPSFMDEKTQEYELRTFLLYASSEGSKTNFVVTFLIRKKYCSLI